MRFERFRISVMVAASFATALACSDPNTKSGRVAPDIGSDVPAEAAGGTKYAAADTQGDPDNTGRNARDSGGTTLTPADQSNSAPDIAMTQKVRSGITSNDAMSVQARNVKIITQDGVVTLRGPVASEQEKASIEALARNAGATRIDNQIEIDRDTAPGEEE